MEVPSGSQPILIPTFPPFHITEKSRTLIGRTSLSQRSSAVSMATPTPVYQGLLSTPVNLFHFQPTDSTKDYIALKSKLDNKKSIIKELDILQNDYFALPDKVNLKDSLDTLSDLQNEAEETKVSLLVLLSNDESKKETVNNTSKNNHVKLPDLPLLTFSGKFQEFEQFKLQFMNLIGNNPTLKTKYRNFAISKEHLKMKRHKFKVIKILLIH
ncbi:DUF1758 domain-containing protein [Trichonephila inaurata madagascariensis]|uniref:DUF1758 domain-containing protein n=1 Tax=Trichonephila inaurata madagascariensis TaxID=2747483 RepID=A0A8X6XFH5_9ARAC|nr:DUF1758 domain-containing protein [Trichonephila inaurata madagascariensis]